MPNLRRLPKTEEEGNHPHHSLMTALTWQQNQKGSFTRKENQTPKFLMNTHVISKWNPTICKRSNISLPSWHYETQGWFHVRKFTNTIYHNYGWKKKNRMIISIEKKKKKTTWWNQMSTPDKNSQYMRKRWEVDFKNIRKDKPM